MNNFNIKVDSDYLREKIHTLLEYHKIPSFNFRVSVFKNGDKVFCGVCDKNFRTLFEVTVKIKDILSWLDLKLSGISKKAPYFLKNIPLE